MNGKYDRCNVFQMPAFTACAAMHQAGRNCDRRFVAALTKTTQFAGKEEADIEDLLGWDLYRHLVNKAMNLHQQIEITDDADAVGQQRLVKFVEEKFKVMPVGVPEFDHYKPAEYLLGVQAADRDNLPGIEVALDRFEALFTALNALLVKG